MPFSDVHQKMEAVVDDMNSIKTDSGLGETPVSDGLDRSGYHYPHGKQYYKDGRICEPPKKVDSDDSRNHAGNEPAAASQSKWNFNDYHWEERDISGMVKQMLNDRLLNNELWRDKKAENDVLLVSSCDIEGWAVSNVRKGSTKNLWEFGAKINFHGLRGGAELNVCVTFPGLDQDMNFDVLPPPQIDSVPGSNLIYSKSIDEKGNVFNKVVGQVDHERAMKTNELFLNFIRRKGIPMIQNKISEVLKELFVFGKTHENPLNT